MTGIEPALSAWEAEVLPLNYIRMRHPLTRGSVDATHAILASWADTDESARRMTMGLSIER
jgi:hypothetical protein